MLYRQAGRYTDNAFRYFKATLLFSKTGNGTCAYLYDIRVVICAVSTVRMVASFLVENQYF
jgi:hypothetical protein